KHSDDRCRRPPRATSHVKAHRIFHWTPFSVGTCAGRRRQRAKLPRGFRAQATAHRATTLRIRVTPNARGRLLLDHHRLQTTLKLSITYTPTGGRPHSARYRSI